MYHVIDSKDDTVYAIRDSLIAARRVCEFAAEKEKRPFYVDEVRRVWSSHTLDELLREGE